MQALRGIAALLVVLFHLRIVEHKYGVGEGILPEFTRFADSGVDLFFVISGFMMATIAVGTYGHLAAAGRFLARRAWRVLPLYWFYTSLVVALMLLAPGMANSAYQDQSILASYLLWPQDQLPVLTVGWTLIHEMYFYLVVAVMIAFGRDRHVPGMLMAWAALVAIAQLMPGPQTPSMALVTNPMTFEFIMGALVGLYWHRAPRRAGQVFLWVGALAFAAAMPALQLAGVDQHVPMLRAMVFGGSATLLVLGAACMEHLVRARIPGWLKAIGDSSYSLYLSHVFAVSAIGRIWSMSGWNQSWWQHLLFVLISLIACVLVGMASYKWLERPLLALLRRRRGSALGVQRA